MRSSILTSKRAKALRREMTEPEVMLWSRLKRRDAWLRSQGVTVYRTTASSVYEDLNEVADGVRRLAAELAAQAAAPSTTPSAGRGPPPPSPPRRGRQGS